MVCGLGGLTRERSVPSDASATRGGGETVPLVECSFTVAKAGTTSDVRRLGRMNAACEAAVRLLARLRPFAGEGDGGSVAGLDSWGCWISSARSIGQRCTRRRKPYRPCVRISSGLRFLFFFVDAEGKIRTLMTPKLANLRISMPRLRTSWSCIHSKTVFPGLIREYR